ncbi:hypothetical protein [Demequina litorisediminis]|uniref:hypothetical protein n=1 Tax=Demequina litorisediminis TaxID=1849022 RepID=UPI0024E0DBC5|nr:hypothetical protein [Demequina litorisediminis]
MVTAAAQEADARVVWAAREYSPAGIAEQDAVAAALTAGAVSCDSSARRTPWPLGACARLTATRTRCSLRIATRGGATGGARRPPRHAGTPG